MNNIQNFSKKNKLPKPICLQSSVSSKQCNLLIFVIAHFKILTHQTYIIIKENSQSPISPIYYKYPHQNSSNRNALYSSVFTILFLQFCSFPLLSFVGLLVVSQPTQVTTCNLSPILMYFYHLQSTKKKYPYPNTKWQHIN